jgi:hypothetical protein
MVITEFDEPSWNLPGETKENQEIAGASDMIWSSLAVFGVLHVNFFLHLLY